MLNNFARVNDSLFRSSAPAINDVLPLKQLGFNKIVSLDKETGQKINTATKLLGIEHIMLPIEIGNRKSLLKFLRQDLFSLLQDDGRVLVHCAQGKDRTGLTCALFRCRYQGWSCQKALSEAKSFGFGIGVDPKIIRLYVKIIQDSCEHRDHSSKQDVNDAYDIVGNERQWNGDYRDYTQDANSQISWSPYEDYRIREFPFSPVDSSRDYGEQYQSRLDYGLSDELPNTEHKDIQMPQSGQYNSITEMLGAGPSMVGSGYVY